MKERMLQYQMENYTSQSFTDHHKHVQQVPCFDQVIRDSDNNILSSSEGTSGAPSLCIGNPNLIIVQRKELVVLAVALVNHLKFASKDNLDELSIHRLADPTARVDSQICCLIPALLNNDPTQVHNRCLSLQMEVSCGNNPSQGVIVICC